MYVHVSMYMYVCMFVFRIITSHVHVHVIISGKAASAGDMLTTIQKEVKTVPTASDGEKGCESCYATTSPRWVSWGPAHEHCRLCGHCYIYWRKYGGLKLPTKWGEFV